MKKYVALILSILIVLACVGCGGKNEDVSQVDDPALIGTWAEEYFDSGYVFNADGTGTDTFWNLTFTYTAGDGKIALAYDDKTWGSNNYVYKIEGNVLTMTRSNDAESTFSYKRVGEAGTNQTGQNANDPAESEPAQVTP